MDDSAIIELFLSRSEKAIEESQKKYGEYLLYIAHGILGNREDAEECVNDTFLNAWNSIPEKRPCYLGAYLGKIVRNLSINRLKTLSSQKRGLGIVPLDISDFEGIVFQQGNVCDNIEKEELIRTINAFLAEEKKLNRIVFSQRYWYLLDIKEIAKINGISESKTKSILHRIRKKLKKKLEKEGYNV